MIWTLIYPQLCIHCKEESKTLLCTGCRDQLELLTALGRCPTCFSVLDGSCMRCRKRSRPIRGIAAACEHRGAAAALLDEFKIHSRFQLARTLASYMIVQHSRLEWPIPDLIVPVPQFWIQSFERVYNPSLLLAKEMAAIWGCEITSLLKRQGAHFSQRRLSSEERERLDSESFQWKKRKDLSDKIVLVVDDLIGTGTTLHHAALRLKEGFPKAVYGIAFSILDA